MKERTKSNSIRDSRNKNTYTVTKITTQKLNAQNLTLFVDQINIAINVIHENYETRSRDEQNRKPRKKIAKKGNTQNAYLKGTINEYSQDSQKLKRQQNQIDSTGLK